MREQVAERYVVSRDQGFRQLERGGVCVRKLRNTTYGFAHVGFEGHVHGENSKGWRGFAVKHQRNHATAKSIKLVC